MRSFRLKAVVKEDIIIQITERGDTEIGALPQGVGLERLRWNGSEIVDLITLNQMWVRYVGFFELHCIQVPDSVLVDMTYADRKKLTQNGDTIRLLTQEEIDDLNIKDHNDKLKIHAQTNRCRGGVIR